MPDESTLAIRDARDDDRPAIEALTLRAYAQYATRMAPDAWAALERALRAALATAEPVERIVAERQGEIVGSVLLYPAGAHAYGAALPPLASPEVRLLSVDPAARGLRVGRALMDECVRRARQAGAIALGIHTSRSMEIAMAMYRRMGFVRTPEHDFQPPGAEVVEAYALPLERHAADAR